jgi:predicted ATP-dependent endonuclease of OLD family
MNHHAARSSALSGDLMINQIEIKNYKCFEHLHVSHCGQINLIVGDNGAGKTALLEAIFMALGMASEMVLRFRQARGLDGSFKGTPRNIEDTIWRDYFYNLDLSRSISITLSGTGPESRSVWIDRGQRELLVPLNTDLGPSSSSVQFQWKDAQGHIWRVVPEFSQAGLKFPETGEDLPDFFFFGSNQTYSSTDNADKFSRLSRDRKKKFVSVFTEQYSWLEDLAIESTVGSPAIYATVKGLENTIPVTSISGGINRIVTFLLTMASRDQSVILVDEIENGLFHTHHDAYWKAIIEFSREFNSQIFLTTHSEEWIESLARIYTAKKDDVSLWRLGRSKDGPIVKQFTGESLKTSIDIGGEVR